MAARGAPHIYSVNALNKAFVFGVGDRAIVSVQNSVRLSRHSEPEPDLAILRPEWGQSFHVPEPADVLLLIEVSDTSPRRDLEVKLPLYAAARIPEVWIVDLDAKHVHLFRLPHESRYTEARVVASGTVSPLTFPDITLTLTDFLR